MTAVFGTLAEVSRANADNFPDKPAFIFEGEATSFTAFERQSNQVAHALLAMGVLQGDRIAYLGKNSADYFELLFGAAKAGAVMSPVNWRLAQPEIGYILKDSGAKILFVGAEFVDLVPMLQSACPALLNVIAMESGSSLPAYRNWRGPQPDTSPDHQPAPDDAAMQLYTSGTTGHPKGAILTHRSLLGSRGNDDAPVWTRWTADDVGLVAMPCFHIGGTGFGLSTLFHGATGVVLREFAPVQVLDAIDEYRISKIFMVPAAMQIIVNLPKARSVDYSALKYMTYGASPIPLDLLKTCMEVFGCGFVQMYGMTETSGTIVALPPEDHDPNGNPRMRSVGKPLAGIEIKIIDGDGATLPPHTVGEIATRSVANMRGYWNLPDATAQTIDGEGWLRTGDAGYLDDDGYLYIHDRVKDMIISGGENIYPAEVENAVYGHPAVADVAVIGVPDAKWGEAVKACVVLREGMHASEADIITWARENIAAYKSPKSVDFIAALPRNPSGKILRRELRAPYWAGAERQVN